MEIKLNKLKIILKILILSLFINSCNGQNKIKILEKSKEEIKKHNNDENTNFLDKKYLTGYLLNIDGSSLSEHPIVNYLDCENEGYFTMHFIPKSDTLRVFWRDKYNKINKYEYDDLETENKHISGLLKNNYNLYNIFLYKINKEYIVRDRLCSEESVNIKDNSIASIYLLDQTNNSWNLIKQLKENVLPPYHDNNYFLKLFPKLFSFDRVLNLNENKTIDKTENSTLSKKFIFKFSISKIEDEDGDEIQKIKIDLKNKETNKIQEIDFTPKLLVTQFEGSPLNSISYFEKEKTTIKSYQEIEGGRMLIALDVNFDGLEDFAIINYQGSNGGPQYAYFVQNANKQFVLDSYLTETVRFFPFEINKNKKTLTITYPSGCCQIQTIKYQIQPNGEWKVI